MRSGRLGRLWLPLLLGLGTVPIQPRAALPQASDAGCSISDRDLETVTAILERWVERRRRLEDVPGMSLGLACGAEWTWSAGFGLADRERGLAATDTTPFRIASITKVFTALAVMRLRDEGRLALDDPVSAHLPWFAPRNAARLPTVTIRHLLTHTSGLPVNSAETDFNAMTQPTVRGAIRALPAQSLVFPPGSDFKYSNLGFAVLGQVVAAVSGVPYRRYLEERVLGPLGLRRTVAHPVPDAVQAAGYHAREPDRPRRRADFLHLASFTPAGGMATTASDMARFLSSLLAPARAASVLAPETLREMWRVHHAVDSARGGAGLAWAVERRPGGTEVYHGGGLPTQTSHLRLSPDSRLGVAVLTNAEDADPAAYAVEALALLRLAAGAAAGTEEAGGGGGVDLERYVGRYGWQDRELWVVRLGGRPWLLDLLGERPSASATRLVPIGEDRFRIEAGWARGEVARFVLDDDGRVLRLRLPAFLYRRVGPVGRPDEDG